MLHDLQIYAAAYSFAALFVIFGLVLIVPTLLIVGVVWLSSRYAKRYGKLAVLFVIGVALATYLLAWNDRRADYFKSITAIEARIAKAPKLGRIDGRNLPLLTADYPFPEIELSSEDCFPDLWTKYPQGGAGPWRGGMSGTTLVMGVDRSPHETFMQVDGTTALRIDSVRLLEAMDQSRSLTKLLLAYVHVLMVQTAACAVGNAHHRLEARLARWLLMCHDRVDGDEILLTHDFMAMMIGSQRSGVTVTLHVLEGMGAIRSKRGRVVVLDREKLEDLAGDAFGEPEGEYRRLIAPFGRKGVVLQFDGSERELHPQT